MGLPIYSLLALALRVIAHSNDALEMGGMGERKRGREGDREREREGEKIRAKCNLLT